MPTPEASQATTPPALEIYEPTTAQPPNMTAVGKAVRFAVLRRDRYTCRYCGRSAPDFPMSVDHVIPRTLGGTNDPSNLVACCADCNVGKGASTADATSIADVDSDLLRWANALARAAALQRATADEARLRIEAFEQIWPAELPRDADWRITISDLLASGLTTDDLVDAIHTLDVRNPRSRTWRAFCGICWTQVERRRALTIQLLAAESPIRAA